MSDIGTGDWVECVDDQPFTPCAPGYRAVKPPLVFGALYCVESVGWPMHWDGDVGEGIRLVGVPPPLIPHSGYRIERFRPIRDDPKAVIREAKRDASVKERVE